MEISEGELRRIESGPPAEAEPAFVVRVFFTADEAVCREWRGQGAQPAAKVAWSAADSSSAR